ncbi:Plastidial pyruvate kinase 2 [Porphyridium purpureum]|uniref:Pyruvate kinase n=1 Tax=Porphyridium purpureum TaxID=35688 RepID=A0A5J4YLA0_PORPP|nr:Plastidial pyruvate kinase 2 [Porphyridium purpureum]|eukprot:POR3734..scf249_10
MAFVGYSTGGEWIGSARAGLFGSQRNASTWTQCGAVASSVCARNKAVRRGKVVVQVPVCVASGSSVKDDVGVGAQDAASKTAASGASGLRVSTRKNLRRQSKVVCTIGPKTCSLAAMDELATNGMDIVRLNMSHGTHEWHQAVIDNVRDLNLTGRYNLGIMLDTKGPEVRSGDLKTPIEVKRGERFVWTTRKSGHSFGEFCTEVSYDDFVNDVQVGDTLLVDGGISSFLIVEKTELDVITECIDGGVLTSRRHLNVRGKSASLPAITDKDWEDIKFGLKNNVDFYALSFVKHEDDVAFLKDYLREHGSEALVLPKIESAEAVPRLRQILQVADGAMVARGDLGAELPVEDVPLVQAEIVRINRELKKPTIVATHMLESMIVYPTPTRAEVTDISEAIKQSADATMLSGETAGGNFPVLALQTMSRVAQSVFDLKLDAPSGEFYEIKPAPGVGDASLRSDIAYSAAVLARDLKAAAIVIFTRAGNYAREVSAVRPRCPVLAFSPSADLKRRLALSWGIDSYNIQFDTEDPEKTIHRAMQYLTQKGEIRKGEVLVIVSDMLNGKGDSVNSIQLRVIR